MSSVSKDEAAKDFDKLLLLAQHEPVHVRDDDKDVVVIISPDAYGRLLARGRQLSPNPLIMELFEKSVAKRGAIYEALARWEAEHPESSKDHS